MLTPLLIFDDAPLDQPMSYRDAVGHTDRQLIKLIHVLRLQRRFRKRSQRRLITLLSDSSADFCQDISSVVAQFAIPKPEITYPRKQTIQDLFMRGRHYSMTYMFPSQTVMSPPPRQLFTHGLGEGKTITMIGRRKRGKSNILRDILDRFSEGDYPVLCKHRCL